MAYRKRKKGIDMNHWHSDYKGPRWTYGLRYRPMQIGAQPRDFILESDGPVTERHRFGTIQYPRKLTEEELLAYEMEEIAQ